jgi:hypothetical protein
MRPLDFLEWHLKKFEMFTGTQCTPNHRIPGKANNINKSICYDLDVFHSQQYSCWNLFQGSWEVMSFKEWLGQQEGLIPFCE